jgi:hypothetical protein
MSKSTRIFSFGLGHSPSRALVKGLSSTTDGYSVFIPPATNVDIYVLEQLQKALVARFSNIKIKWNLNSKPIHVVPTNPPTIFINDRLIVYAILDDKSTSFDHNVSVELYSEENRLGEAKVNQIPSVSDNGMIGRLAAKALILELEHSKLPSSTEKDVTKETIKRNIIDISLKYNILSPYTAFVGVENRVDGNNSDMILREVPIQISADNQYLKYLEKHIKKIHDRRSLMRELHHKKMLLEYKCQEYRTARAHYSEKEYLLDQECEVPHYYCETPRKHLEAEEFMNYCEGAKESSPQDYKVARKKNAAAQDYYHNAQSDYSKTQYRYQEAKQRHDDREHYYRNKQLYAEAKHRYQRAQELLIHHMSTEDFSLQDSEKTMEYITRYESELGFAEQEFQMAVRHLQICDEDMELCEMTHASLQDDADNVLRSDIDRIEALRRYEHEKQSSKKSKVISGNNDEKDKDIIRQVISEQKFDGLWEIDTKIIQQLTGKLLSDFQSVENSEILVTAIIMLVIETRFASLSSMWYGVIQKARVRLLNIFENNNDRLENLLKSIREQI